MGALTSGVGVSIAQGETYLVLGKFANEFRFLGDTLRSELAQNHPRIIPRSLVPRNKEGTALAKTLAMRAAVLIA